MMLILSQKTAMTGRKIRLMIWVGLSTFDNTPSIFPLTHSPRCKATAIVINGEKTMISHKYTTLTTITTARAISGMMSAIQKTSFISKFSQTSLTLHELVVSHSSDIFKIELKIVKSGQDIFFDLVSILSTVAH